MAKPSANTDVVASINEELWKHYQRLVDAYRPDLKGDKTEGEPIFHHLIPCHLKNEQEMDKREISVADLLTIQLHENASGLPRHVLLLGRPESGKTALFALILHYWLHGRSTMNGLKDFDLLLAVQCLGLENLSSDGKTVVDLEKHMLDHIPDSIKKYGEEVVQQTMREAKVLIMIDSLDCLREEINLAPWSHRRVVLFCRYKFVKDNPSHVFFTEQSEDYLVLKLWGGMTVNPFQTFPNSPEDISELDGVFSEKILRDYCYRLCTCKNMDFKKFWNYYTKMLKYFSKDMRKPFNIYMAMEAFCDHTEFDVTTQSELYGKWFEFWSKLYKSTIHKSDYNPVDLIVKGTPILSKMAYKAFTSNKEYFSCEENNEHPELVPFFSHFLIPHYNPHGRIQHFTFRIAVHRFFLAAKHIVTVIDLGPAEMADILRTEEYNKLHSLLPMILGIARGSNHYEKLKEHAIVLAKLILEDHVTKPFRDQIINYAVTILSETRLLSKKDPFVNELVNCLKENNWTIIDGNMHPEALRVLCECGHDTTERNKHKPTRLNINLEDSPDDMEGLTDILKAVKDCDLRINLCCKRSIENEDGKLSLDKAVYALQGNGKASLASISGYLKDIKKLDTDPATRRTYRITLRICSNKEYEWLHEVCRNSHKLNRVMLRISYKADINPNRLKELSANICDLTVYLEGFNDEEVEKSVQIWRSIQGTAQRKVRKLRFWDITKRVLTPTAVKFIICADLSATRIEVPLDQPVSEFDKDDLQKELNNLKEDKYTIRFKGSHHYPRFDMKKVAGQLRLTCSAGAEQVEGR